MDAPKVFLSHASEDKERFVRAFALALRAGGLDVWVDEWEILPGDSIVKKIFAEGIEQAAGVVVVISATSITKPWVAEELDAAVVKRINEQSRLIPVVLDGLSPDSVPASIRHLLWVAVPDSTNLEDAAHKVIDAVFGVHQRPSIGAPPSYVATPIQQVDGLGQIDSLVLKTAGEEAIRDFGEVFMTVDFVATLASLGVPESAALESLEVLDHDRIVNLHRTLGRGLESMHRFTLTSMGLEQYLRTYVHDYESMVTDICMEVVNGGEQGSDSSVATATGHPGLIVLHVLRLLEGNGLLKLSKSLGPTTSYFGVSPKLRRMLVD